MERRNEFGSTRGRRLRGALLISSTLPVLMSAPWGARAESTDSAEAANAAYERFERDRSAALEGDPAARFAAASAVVDSAAADLREIEAAVVAAVQEERASVWGEPIADEGFVWVEYDPSGRERRQVDFALKATQFQREKKRWREAWPIMTKLKLKKEKVKMM